MFDGAQESPKFLAETVETTPTGTNQKVIDVFNHTINALDGTEFAWTDEDLEGNKFSVLIKKDRLAPFQRGKITGKYTPMVQQIEKGKEIFHNPTKPQQK